MKIEQIKFFCKHVIFLLKTPKEGFVWFRYSFQFYNDIKLLKDEKINIKFSAYLFNR